MFNNDNPFDDDFFKNSKGFDDPFFKDFHERHSSFPHGVRVMDVLAPALSVLALVVLLALCCACCRRTRYSGRVLAPGNAADAPNSVVTSTTTYVHAPYPQQPYAATVTAYPASQGAPYPTVVPYPTAAPYPAAAPYPTQQWGGMPLPAPAATAPAGDALPPSYEQVVAAAESKHPPYNPHYPH